MTKRRLREAHPATLLFASAVLCSGALLLYWLSKLTFWRDEWDFLLHRRGFSAGVYLDPFVEHLLAIPIGIYQVLVAVFGMGSAVPEQVVSTALFLLSVIALFVYLRPRVDPWLALAAVLPLLFFGQSWDDILFPFQMAFFGSVACGIGALLALDREDRLGDLAATALLTVSLLFSGLGVPFVVGAVVDIGLTRERFKRAYVVVIPTALYALWYLGWGHNAETFISLHNLATSPSYVIDGFSSSLSSLLGVGVNPDEAPTSTLDWGQPLLLVAVGLAAWRIHRIGGISRRLWAVLAIGLSFWSLTALNASIFGTPTSGRYQYVGAICIVMIGAELLRGVRLTRIAAVAAVAVAVVATLANFSYLRVSAERLADIAVMQRSGLAALELTRGEVDPAFLLTPENSGVDYLGVLDAGSYFSAIDAHGSPAYSPAELAGAAENGKVSADQVFAAALGLTLAPADSAAGHACSGEELGAQPTLIAVPSGGVVLHTADATAAVSARRYAAESFPIDLGSVGPGQSAALQIPGDGSSQPWQLQLTGQGSLAVCAQP